MPCPRVPKPMDGQRTNPHGRTVLMQGTERAQQAQPPALPREAITSLGHTYGCRCDHPECAARRQDTRQDAPGEVQDASAPRPASQRVGCQDWEMDANGSLLHVGCGGAVKTAGTNLPRRFCRRPGCRQEWWLKDGFWRRV